MRTQHLEQQSPDKPEQPEERHPYALDILAMAIGVSFGSAGIAAAACFAIIRRLRCVAVLVVDLGQQLGYNVQTHADAYAWFPYLRNEQSAKELPRKRLPETADSELSRLLVAPLPARSSASSNTHDQASLLQMERIRAEQRQHTIITARPGDGKTHTSICMLVADIVRGCQVLWLSPARILFHHREQPIDLRPLAAAGLLEHHKDPKTIAQVLHLSGQLVAERNEQLEQDEDVGHPICLYLDEWPHLVAECPQIEDTLGKILRTARKTNIWIILATQDAHVETIRLHGGLRAAFSTRLIGNVDRATWNALADPDQERQRVSQGQWLSLPGCIPALALSSVHLTLSLLPLQAPTHLDTRQCYPALRNTRRVRAIPPPRPISPPTMNQVVGKMERSLLFSTAVREFRQTNQRTSRIRQTKALNCRSVQKSNWRSKPHRCSDSEPN